MSCTKLCKKLKRKQGYANGQKLCGVCNVFIKTEEKNCPCCGYKLFTSRPKPYTPREKMKWHF